jgi:DivIVA domain-containing protein
MAFMPEDVLNKNFTATQFRRGYDEHEVDDFLDEIVVELRRLSSDNDDLLVKLKACQEDKGVIPPEAQDKIAAARVAAEKAEKDSAARIAKATADAEQAEAEAAERAKAAKEAADEIARSAVAVPAPAPVEAKGTSQVGGPAGAGVGSAAGVLALAQKLHEEYVTEGQNTRERLISEGQSRHDQVVGDATARHDELLSTGQAKHDELIAEATARHEQMITEARHSSTGMVTEAKQKRTEVLEALGRERILMQKKIEELRTFERDYRARLKTHLEDQLRVLEQAGVDETADVEGDGQQQGGQQQGGQRHEG